MLIIRFRPDGTYQVRTRVEIARLRGEDAVTTVIGMVREAGPDIGIIGTSMDERSRVQPGGRTKRLLRQMPPAGHPLLPWKELN